MKKIRSGMPFWGFIMLLFPAAVLGQTQGAAERVSLQLQWKHQFEFAGFYAARENGYYADAGLDVEIREYARDRDIIAAVLTGEATFGTLYSNAIRARMEGKPVILLANYFKRSPLVFAVQPDIYFPGDLRGKKVMGEKHELDSANFSQMFRQFNMSADDFTVVPHTFTIEKFVNGEVDAMTVFLTNEVYQLRRNKILFNIIDPNNYGVPLYDVTLFTSKSYALERPAAARAFIEASNRGWEYALANPEAMVDLILAKYNTQNKSRAHLLYEAEKTQRMVQPDIYPIGSIDPLRIKKIQELFVSEGVAQTIVEPESFIFGYSHPQIIGLTAQEKKYIEKHPIIRVIRSFHQPPFTVHGEDGSVTGYLHDLLAEVCRIAGLEIHYVQGGETYDAMVEAVQQGTADLLPNMNSTRQLPDTIARTVAVVTTSNGLVSKISAPQIKETSELFSKKVAVVKGYAQDQHLRRFPQIHKVHVTSNDEGFAAVRMDRAEYFLNNLANAGYILQKTFATDLRISGELAYADFPPLSLCFAVRQKYPELPAIISKALAAVPFETRSRLRQKWLAKELVPARVGKYDLALTDAEKAYLSTKKQITMCIDPNWAPYEEIDENGNYVGLTADYFEVFQRMIPVPIELVKTDSWDESVQYAKARKCDILSMLNKSPKRSKYLNFTEPYIRANVVLIARNDVVYLDGLKSLSGKTLAIVKNYVYEEIVSKDHPEIKIVPVENLSEGLKKVSDGSVFAAIGSLLPILPTIQGMGLTNLKVAGPAKLQNEFRIGARNDEAELVSIFDKAVNAMDQETENEILRRWYTVSVAERFDYSLVWKIVGAAAIIVVVVLYWNRRLSIMAGKISKAKDAAEAANTAKSAFLANMSHELRTPLNAILGFSELMLRDTGITREQRANLATIGRSGEHLLSLINDVLEFTKIEAGRIGLNRENVDLHNLLLGLEEMFRLRAREKDLSLNFERESDVPRYIRADQGKLRQILINLLGNAVKFTATGGITLLVTSKAPAQRGKAVRRRYLFFEVVDTGVGICAKEQDKIFDTFYQTDAQRTSIQGAGLGLSISRKFANLMDGELTVDSEIGRGTRFIFKLPVELGNGDGVASSQPTRRVAGLVPGQPALRLLAVEDNINNRNLLVKLLRTVGFEVREAVNGQDAVEIWQTWRPHLIWMDMRMPVMDGYEATRRIRQAEKKLKAESSKLITDDRTQMTDDRDQRTDDRDQRTDDRDQRTDARDQRTDDRDQRTDDREQKTDDRRPISEMRDRNAEIGVKNQIGQNSELTSAIRNPKSKISAVPIIALTASAFEEDRLRVIMNGCDDFIRKPFREYEIFAMIKKHLGVRYDYEEKEVSENLGAVAEKMPDQNLASAINSLPEELVVKLKEVTELSDVTLIDEVIEEIRNENAQLASALSERAENFAYDNILSLVQRRVS